MTTKAFLWLGLDVAKATFDAALPNPKSPSDLRIMRVETFTRTPEGVAGCLAWVGPDALAGIVLEATGRYSEELADWLQKASPTLVVAIVNPAHAKAFGKSLGLRGKTDRQDARMLARFAMERRPRAFKAWEPALKELQALSRERDALVRTRVSERLRAQESNLPESVQAAQTKVIEAITVAIENLESAMERLLQSCTSLREDVAHLEDLPGVGRITATTVLAELGDLRRFERSRQISAFAGVSPRKHESGTSVRGRSRMCKEGNSRVRSALYLAALSASRVEGPLKQAYLRLVANGKTKRSALGAVMRKLLVLMRAVLISGRPYDPAFEAHRD